MTDADPVPPALPSANAASPAVAQAGCVAACGLALLPILYVGSFAFFAADQLLDWGFWEALDDRTEYLLQILYWPLIQLYLQLVGLG